MDITGADRGSADRVVSLHRQTDRHEDGGREADAGEGVEQSNVRDINICVNRFSLIYWSVYILTKKSYSFSSLDSSPTSSKYSL